MTCSWGAYTWMGRCARDCPSAALSPSGDGAEQHEIAACSGSSQVRQGQRSRVLTTGAPDDIDTLAIDRLDQTRTERNVRLLPATLRVGNRPHYATAAKIGLHAHWPPVACRDVAAFGWMVTSSAWVRCCHSSLSLVRWTVCSLAPIPAQVAPGERGLVVCRSEQSRRFESARLASMRHPPARTTTKLAPSSPPQRPLTLAGEKDDFTSEGAPPPGFVGTDLPHRRSAGPSTSLPRKAAPKKRRPAAP